MGWPVRDLTVALERLAFIVPLSIGVILLLLLANFRSVRDMLLAASAMPLALIGGVYALAITATPFSVSRPSASSASSASQSWKASSFYRISIASSMRAYQIRGDRRCMSG